ncbi:hypothetical protein SAMN05216344_10699 [Polaromonas sp. OV174]|uniref:hypothetical protein n=1 Tax=Polaromonas sp. OV174 TaxID=1855300 RepID=UPI0008F29A87|nr:hypothetical protein [Polaromonas sp. OV174]SFB96102.1 hypothetical protein SAMN05216344_10699 [Polaromonas sp. OV174]
MSSLDAVIKLRAFLTMGPANCTTGPSLDAERGFVLVGRDIAGRIFPQGFSAQWLGAEALQFLEAHRAELIPGRCVDLEIYHVRPVNTELRARIKSCQLAPLAPSWIAHEEKRQQAATPTTPSIPTTDQEQASA